VKIFEVSVTKTILVLAEDEREAELEAGTYESEEDGDVHVVGEITSMDHVPEQWKDALPYGGDGEQTIKQILTPPDPPPPPFVDPPEQLRIFPGGQPA
jgi:hypothetical protein